MISSALRCPVTIEDASHRLLAYNSHDDRTDHARISTIIRRQVPENIVNQLWKDGTIPALLKTADPVRVNGISSIGLGNRVAIAIRNKNDLLGFIWALETDKTFSDEDIKILKNAAATARTKLLQLQIKKNNKEGSRQELFWKMLTGHLESENEINDQFIALEIQSAACFIVAAIDFGRTLASQEEKDLFYLAGAIPGLTISLHTVDSNLYILLLASESEAAAEEAANCLASRLTARTPGARPAFSSPFTRRVDTKAAYQESLAVLAIKEKFPSEANGIHFYQHLGIYQLMEIVREKRLNSGYVNKHISRLNQYDEKHHTNLAETLEVFLSMDCNANEAARVLNVHANTLNYRLKRISEIGGINFRDPNQKMLLYLDLKLAKFT